MKKLIHNVTDAGITFKVEGKGGTYTKPLPERITISEGATTAWDGETSTLTVTITTEGEGEEPTVEETDYVLTQQEIDDAWAWTPPPPVPPLTDRLKAYLDAQPAAVRAQFEPLRRPVWDAIERGDLEVAQILIQGATVPPELESVRTEMLAEFPEAEEE